MDYSALGLYDLNEFKIKKLEVISELTNEANALLESNSVFSIPVEKNCIASFLLLINAIKSDESLEQLTNRVNELKAFCYKARDIY
jgi:hypothetical protein